MHSELSNTGRTGRVGNLGKATSFVDPEGDGDVMPKLVDMLTKVAQCSEIPFSVFESFYAVLFRLELKCQSSLVKVKVVLEEKLGEMMMRTGANKS